MDTKEYNKLRNRYKELKFIIKHLSKSNKEAIKSCNEELLNLKKKMKIK